MASKKSPLRTAFEAIACDCDLMQRGRESIYQQLFPELRPRLVTADEATRKAALQEGDRLWERLTGLPPLVGARAWERLAEKLGFPPEGWTINAVTSRSVAWASNLDAVGRSDEPPNNVPAGNPRQTANDRMLAQFTRDRRCIGWSAAVWSAQLGVAKSTVTSTPTWKLIQVERERERREKQERGGKI